MVKEVKLTFSDDSYRTLETMANEVGCSPDQLIRESLGWSYLIQAGIEHDPYGRLDYVATNSQVILELVSEAAFSQYIKRLQAEIPQEKYNPPNGRTIIRVDSLKLFGSTDKK